MYSLPSTSQTWLPSPRSMIGARPSGNWSSPLAYVCAPPGTTSASRAPTSSERSIATIDPPLCERADTIPEAGRAKTGRQRPHGYDGAMPGAPTQIAPASPSSPCSATCSSRPCWPGATVQGGRGLPGPPGDDLRARRRVRPSPSPRASTAAHSRSTGRSPCTRNRARSSTVATSGLPGTDGRRATCSPASTRRKRATRRAGLRTSPGGDAGRGRAATRSTAIPRPASSRVDAGRHIVLGDDPTGRRVEVVVRQTWMTVAASDVTVEGFTMRYASNAPQTGALRVDPGISRFTLRDCDLGYAAGADVAYGTANDSVVEDCDIHDGGQLGVHLGGDGTNGRNNVLRNSRVHDNNTAGFDADVGGGRAQGDPPDRPAARGQHGGQQCRPGAVVRHRLSRHRRDRQPDPPQHLRRDHVRDQHRRDHPLEPGLGERLGRGRPGAGARASSSAAPAAPTCRDNIVAWNYAGISVISQDRGSVPRAGHQRQRPRQRDHGRVRPLGRVLGPGLGGHPVQPGQQQPRLDQPLLDQPRRGQPLALPVAGRPEHPRGVQRHPRRRGCDLPVRQPEDDHPRRRRHASGTGAGPSGRVAVAPLARDLGVGRRRRSRGPRVARRHRRPGPPTSADRMASTRRDRAASIRTGIAGSGGLGRRRPSRLEWHELRRQRPGPAHARSRGVRRLQPGLLPVPHRDQRGPRLSDGATGHPLPAAIRGGLAERDRGGPGHGRRRRPRALGAAPARDRVHLRGSPRRTHSLGLGHRPARAHAPGRASGWRSSLEGERAWRSVE